MSEYSMDQFFEAVSSDAGLRSKTIAAKSPEDVAAAAAAHGYVISADEFRALAQASVKEKAEKLDDASLAKVVGGLLIGGGAKQEKKTFADYWYQIWYA